MKHDKSPGISGFTTEFFKVFWKQLGYFVLRSANEGFENGELSVTQRLGLTTCISKENKPRQHQESKALKEKTPSLKFHNMQMTCLCF